MPSWLTSEKLREAPQAVPDAAVRKYFTAEKLDMMDQPRRVRFVISTNDVDRDNDTVDPTGWDLSNYKNNPVVLWAHSHKDLPVARAVSVVQEGNNLIAEAEFATHPFAETVYQLIKGGFLRAVSVGFRALEYAINAERGGIDFKRQELLEFSVCPVPANPMALVSASAEGVDMEPLHKWMQDLIEQWPGDLRLRGKAWEKLRPAEQAEMFDIREMLAELSAQVTSLKAELAARKEGDPAPAAAEPAPAPEPAPVAEPVVEPVVEPVAEPAAEVPPAEDAATEDEDGEGIELVESEGDELELELEDPLLEMANDFGVTKSDLETSLREVISSALAEVTQGAVRTAINQARGRLD